MQERPISRAQFPNGAADVAARFGITIKALRLYERFGLITPIRDEKGWRTYGADECRRLHAVLALRQLGFTLVRIVEVTRDADIDLDAVLALQERLLVEQRARASKALALVREARHRLTSEPAPDIAGLARIASLSPVSIRWSPALRDLAASVFTGVQQRRLTRVSADLDGEWASLYVRLRRLADSGDAGSSEAQALGREARDLIDRMTGGSETMRQALVRFWTSSFADPGTASSLPMTSTEWVFLGKIMGTITSTAQEME